MLTARFVSRLGGTAAFFIGTWGTAAYVFDASAKELALMSALNVVAGIIGTAVAGVFIDRVGPRRVLIVAELLSIPAVLALALAGTFPTFIALSMLFSLVGVPTWTAGSSFAPFLVTGRKKLERVNSLIETAGSTGFVFGPGVGAVVSKAFGLDAVFVLMAVCALLAAGCAWFVRLRAEWRPEAKRHPLVELREGLTVSYGIRSLRYYIVLYTLVHFGFGAFSALEPLFYRDVVGVGVEWIGYINTLFGLGIVSGAWLLPRLPDKVVSARGAAIATVLVGTGTVLYVGSANLWFIAAGGIAWGFVLGGMEPLVRTLIHIDAPHRYVGRVMGTIQYHSSAAELVPLAFAPALAVVFGVQPVLIGGGVIVAIAAAVSWREAVGIDEAARCAALEDATHEPPGQHVAQAHAGASE